MNKIVMILTLLVFVSCTGRNNNSKEWNTINKSSFPKIEFEKKAHDFGVIKSGERLIYNFVFTNQGQADLIIERAEVDCGCLNVVLPKKAIEPGQKGFIEIEFNSAGMIGKQLKTIELHSNCKEPKHLIIFAQVENKQIEFKY